MDFTHESIVTGELRVKSDQAIKNGANGDIRRVRVPGSGGGESDEQPIRVIHEWHKCGSEPRGGPAVSRDPATGKHFYTLSGFQVFID
jgi:hypothetical protein